MDAVDLSFDVRLDATGDFGVVHVRGEIDLATVIALERELLRAISVSTQTILDLSACTFIDASGFAAIIRAQRLLQARNAPMLRVVVGDAEIMRSLKRAGIDEFIAIHPSLARASLPA